MPPPRPGGGGTSGTGGGPPKNPGAGTGPPPKPGGDGGPPTKPGGESGPDGKPKPGPGDAPGSNTPSNGGNRNLNRSMAGLAGLGTVGLGAGAAFVTLGQTAIAAGASVAVVDSILDFLDDPYNLAMVTGAIIGVVVLLK